MRPTLFAIRREPSPGRSLVLKAMSFLLPLMLWCVVSYVPGVWHPLVRITDAGDSFFRAGTTIDRTSMDAANAKLAAAGGRSIAGDPENPVYLPAPHRVALAFYTAFTTPPLRKDDPWLHESLAHSLRIIATGFGLACVVGVPVGILCGTFPGVSRVVEPVVDFVRYMPPPVFGALAVAVLGLYDGPKTAIIFVGTVFCMVRVVANTTRQLDPALLEAAMTLGAGRRRLLVGVILPGVLPNLYNDLRILLGAAWTLLTVAELIGVLTGISYFIDRQGKYFRFENVYAGIIMIGLLGMLVDKALTVIGARLFPWQGKPAAGYWGEVKAVLYGGPARRLAPTAAATGPAPAVATAAAPAVPVPMQVDAAVAAPDPAAVAAEPDDERRRADAVTA